MKRKKTLHKILALGLCLLALLSVAACSGGEAGLTLFAAAGAKPALDAACVIYGDAHDAEIAVTYGGAGEVLSQMELTRSGDVYVAPEQSFMEKAVNKQLVKPETVVSIAYMVPVIAVPPDNPLGIEKLEDLAKPGVKVAVTRHETTLLGRYAPEIFAKAGLAEEITPNIVTEAARPDSLLTMLVMGQVDAGILWNFYEVQAADKVKSIYMAPEHLTGIGEMRAAVTSFTENGDAAQRFVDFLASSEGKGVFRDLGYVADEAELAKYWKQ